MSTEELIKNLKTTRVSLKKGKSPKKSKFIPFKIEQSAEDTYIFIDDGFINEGSFGAVYKAFSCKTGELVAVKVVKHLDQKEIRHEIDSLKLIQSICQQDVVCYRDDYSVSGEHRIVTDYIKGGYNLSDYIQEIPLKSTPEMVGRQQRNDFAKELIIAIDRLHNSTFITHQDLKEGNLLWDFERDRPRITDLGEICSFDNNCDGDPKEICSEPCGFVGTYYTSNPENEENIKNGDNVPDNIFSETQRHDIWSVGVILLRWYSYKNIKKYDDVYKWNDAKIQQKISKIANNPFAQRLLRLLLERDPDIRLGNWDECVELANGETPEDYLTDVYITLREKILRETSKEAEAKVLAKQLGLLRSESSVKTGNMPRLTHAVVQDLHENFTIAEIATLAAHYGLDFELPFETILNSVAKNNLNMYKHNKYTQQSSH